MKGNGETILIIDDKRNILEVLKGYLENEGYNIVTCSNGEKAIELFKESSPDIILTDFKLPGINGIELIKEIHSYDEELPVIVFTAYGSISSAVEAIKVGGYDYLTKPLDYDLLKIRIRRALDEKKIKMENRFLREELDEQYSMDNLIGKSEPMKRLFSIIRTAAPSSSNILIEGEYGTGKELIAKAIHNLSPRKDKPLITVDCSALPENLLESELFGFEKGAFTGAVNRKQGRIELAAGGTLFLDEIGEMGPNLQAKLLRVIQEKNITRLGGLAPIKVDFRLIAATNRNLAEETKRGNFRGDLFYRLNVIKIEAPPLRDRKEDIPLLVKHFMEKISKRENKPPKRMSPGVIEVFYNYDWPGNVRELENCIERMFILSEGELITEDYLPGEIREYTRGKVKPTTRRSIQGSAGEKDTLKNGVNLEEIEREAIVRALEIASGNKSKAAKLLNIHRKALYNRLKKYGLK